MAGQEEVQNALYRLLGNFVRAGAVNKLFLLHGPNGSAKSAIVDALKRGMEFSRRPQGNSTRSRGSSPRRSWSRGASASRDRTGGGELTTFAHLDEESVEVQVQCEMRDHPLFAMPRIERQKLLERALKVPRAPETGGGPRRLDRRWRLCLRCRRIYNALLAASNGDWLRVLRHVQVRRYLSRRYLVGAVTVEPHLSVDAAYHQVSADRSQAQPSGRSPEPRALRAARPAGERQPRHHGVRRSSSGRWRRSSTCSASARPARCRWSTSCSARRGAGCLQQREAPRGLQGAPRLRQLQGPHRAGARPYLRRWKSEKERSTTRRSPQPWASTWPPRDRGRHAQWAVLTRLKSRSGNYADVREGSSRS